MCSKQGPSSLNVILSILEGLAIREDDDFSVHLRQNELNANISQVVVAQLSSNMWVMTERCEFLHILQRRACC